MKAVRLDPTGQTTPRVRSAPGRCERNGLSPALLLVALSLLPAPAFAYVDPNTGGYLFQLLTPLLLALAAAWAFVRHQTKQLAARAAGAWRSLTSSVPSERSGWFQIWAWPIAGFLLLGLLPASFLFAADSMLKYQGFREVALLYAAMFLFYGFVAMLLACVSEVAVRLLCRALGDTLQVRRRVLTGEAVLICATTAAVWMFFLRVWLDRFGFAGHSTAWRFAALAVTLVSGLIVLIRTLRFSTQRLVERCVDVGRNAALLGTAIALLIAVGALLTPSPLLPNPKVPDLPSLSPASIPVAGAEGDGPDILLITFDALSTHDMSVYGYDRPTTPGLEQFARNAYVFKHAYSSANFTTPAVASLLTANRPWKTRVFQLQSFLRGEEARRNPVMALRNAGYTTAAFTNNPAASPRQNRTAAGFDVLPPDHSGYLRHKLYTGLTVSQRLAVQSLTEVFPWSHVTTGLDALARRATPEAYVQSPQAMLDAAREVFVRLAPDRKTFLWVHVWVPHHFYLPPRPYLYRFASQRRLDDFDSQAALPRDYTPDQQPLADLARARYDENIAFADDLVSRFLQSLSASGSLRNTLIAISADHGEMFAKGIIGHGGNVLYDPMIHVPLMIRTPGQASRIDVNAVAEEIDIMPTLLDLADAPLPYVVEGKSLRSAMNGVAGDDAAFSMWLERESAFSKVTSGKISMLRWPWKIVFDLSDDGDLALYDLAADPQEMNDLSIPQRSRAESMRREARMQLSAAESSGLQQ